MITRYEITARHPDGRTYLVGYTPRKSRRGLLSAMQNVGGPMIEKLDIGEHDEIESPPLGDLPYPPDRPPLE